MRPSEAQPADRGDHLEQRQTGRMHAERGRRRLREQPVRPLPTVAGSSPESLVIGWFRCHQGRQFHRQPGDGKQDHQNPADPAHRDSPKKRQVRCSVGMGNFAGRTAFCHLGKLARRGPKPAPGLGRLRATHLTATVSALLSRPCPGGVPWLKGNARRRPCFFSATLRPTGSAPHARDENHQGGADAPPRFQRGVIWLHRCVRRNVFPFSLCPDG